MTTHSASLAEEAFSKVLEAITSGAYEPGEKLSESELARRLKISRGPIREALGRLEGRLVTRTPRLGVRIVTFGRDELEQLFIVREALEGMAARLAAQHMSNQELDDLERMLFLHGQQPSLNRGERYLQPSQDDDFHFAVARASRCAHIEKLLLDEVYYQLRVQRLKSSAQPGRAQAAFSEHQGIFASLTSRNPSRAEDAMREHIRNARYSALAAMPAGHGADGTNGSRPRTTG